MRAGDGNFGVVGHGKYHKLGVNVAFTAVIGADIINRHTGADEYAIESAGQLPVVKIVGS